MPARTLVTVVLAALLVAAGTARAALPAVSTGGAKNVTQSSALLTGTVDPKGEATTFHFEYGPTKAYGSRTPDQGPASAKVQASAQVDGLAAGTTYHFRLIAANASGTRAGRDKTFKTQATPASVTLAASRGRIVFGRSVTLTGQLTPAPGASAAGVRITLEQDPAPLDPRQFKAVAATQTDANGRFSFTQTPGVNTAYRATAATKPKATSTTLLVRVAFKVTLSLSTAHPRRGGLVVFRGTVAPLRLGRLVRIQRRVAPRRWRTVKTGLLRSATGAQVSRYRVRVRIRKRGVFRAYVSGDSLNAAGASRSRAIRPG